MNEDAFVHALAKARRKLRPTAEPDRTLSTLAAAAFFAIAAMIFCAAAVLAPANVVTPMAKTGVR